MSINTLAVPSIPSCQRCQGFESLYHITLNCLSNVSMELVENKQNHRKLVHGHKDKLDYLFTTKTNKGNS